MIRSDSLGISSVIRDLSIDHKHYSSMMQFFRANSWDLDMLRNQQWLASVANTTEKNQMQQTYVDEAQKNLNESNKISLQALTSKEILDNGMLSKLMSQNKSAYTVKSNLNEVVNSTTSNGILLKNPPKEDIASNRFIVKYKSESGKDKVASSLDKEFAKTQNLPLMKNANINKGVSSKKNSNARKGLNGNQNLSKEQKGSTDKNASVNKKIEETVEVVNSTIDKNLGIIVTEIQVKTSDLLEKLKKDNMDAEIESIQPDYEISLYSNDPYFDKQWGIGGTVTTGSGIEVPNNSGTTGNQIALSNIISVTTGSGITGANTSYGATTSSGISIIGANAAAAWETAEGEGAIVAVLDTGIDIYHEDLAGNIWTNTDEIENNGVDDDRNGYVDDLHGWNFCDKNNNVQAAGDTHGTHVVGIIAAMKDNGKGIVGVAPKAKIMPLKVFKNGTAYTSDIIVAIEYAKNHGAKIVNCSWGTTVENDALKEAITESNMLFVCAAGNNGMNINRTPIYPASYCGNNIITVASINKAGVLSNFSNYGEGSVNVAAPGDAIFSTLPNNGYGQMSGTSMATPFVAGEAALILSECKDLKSEKIKNIILKSSNKIAALNGKVLNNNEINCENALIELMRHSDDDDDPPVEKVLVDSISMSGAGSNLYYKVYAKNVRYRNGPSIKKVIFPTWTVLNGQDDLLWHEGTRIPGTNDWEVTINIAGHKNETGQYITHVYAEDSEGSQMIIGGTNANINSVAFDSIVNGGTRVDGSSFKVTVKSVVCPQYSKIYFPTWTSANGQDDLIWHEGAKIAGTNDWEVTINKGEHKGEAGEYITDVYCRDSGGINTFLGQTKGYIYRILVDSITPNVFSKLGYYKVSAKNVRYEDGTSVNKVLFPTWTILNGQDDLIWHEGTRIPGTNDWEITINAREHKNGLGEYATHVYVENTSGVRSIIGMTSITLADKLVPISVDVPIQTVAVMLHYDPNVLRPAGIIEGIATGISTERNTNIGFAPTIFTPGYEKIPNVNGVKKAEELGYVVIKYKSPSGDFLPAAGTLFNVDFFVVGAGTMNIEVLPIDPSIPMYGEPGSPEMVKTTVSRE